MLAYVVGEAVVEGPGAGAGVVEFAVAGLAAPLPPAAAGVWSAIVPKSCLSSGKGLGQMVSEDGIIVERRSVSMSIPHHQMPQRG